jgi:hypothetical protein
MASEEPNKKKPMNQELVSSHVQGIKEYGKNVPTLTLQ